MYHPPQSCTRSVVPTWMSTLRVSLQQKNKSKTQHVQDQRGVSNKISTFGGKFSTLAEKFFVHPDIQVRPTLSRIEVVEFFPLQWKIFHFQKYIFFIQKSHKLEHSAEVEIFPLLVEIFPLWRNFVFGFWTLAFAKFEPKYAKWKFFHFGRKISTFKKLEKK